MSLRAVAITFLLASSARADVGVVPVAGDVDLATRAHFGEFIVSALAKQHASLLVDARCDVDNKAGALDTHCLDSIVEKKRDLDELVVVTMKKTVTDVVKIQMRVFAPGEWQTPTFTRVVDVPPAQASEMATALVRQAFDPARYSGTAEIIGDTSNAELLIDGLRIERTEVPLIVGKHVLEVNRSGARALVPFDIAYNTRTPVEVPAAAAPAVASSGWPLYVAGAVTAVGLGALVVGAGFETFDVHFLPNFGTGELIDNISEWESHTRDTVGFLPGGKYAPDPACPRDADGTCALDNQGHGLAWGAQYGRQPGRGVSEPARFMMTAVSRENELGWHATEYASVAAMCAGAAMTITGALALYSLWPAPDAPAVAAE